MSNKALLTLIMVLLAGIFAMAAIEVSENKSSENLTDELNQLVENAAQTMTIQTSENNSR